MARCQNGGHNEDMETLGCAFVLASFVSGGDGVVEWDGPTVAVYGGDGVECWADEGSPREVASRLWAG